MSRKKFSLAEHDIFFITSDPDIWSLGNQSYYEINDIKEILLQISVDRCTLTGNIKGLYDIKKSSSIFLS